MFELVKIDGLWNVVYNGTIIDTFVFRQEAEDHIVVLRYEMDHAYDNLGCEFDDKVEVLHTI